MANVKIDGIPSLIYDQTVDQVYASMDEKRFSVKDFEKTIDGMSSSDGDSDVGILSDARELVTHVISIEDDPSLNPWTFRTLILGIGLSTFGGVLGA